MGRRRLLGPWETAQLILALCCFAFPMLLIPLALQESATDRWVCMGLSGKGVKKVTGCESVVPLQYALVAAEGVYRSTDHGLTWSAANRDLPSDAWGRITVQAIAVDPAHSSVVYAGLGDTGRNGDALGAGLYRSDDSGTVWRDSGRDMGGTEVQAIATSYELAGTGSLVCVATVEGIYSSVDEGRTWRRLNWRGRDVSISSIAIHPEDPDVIYVGTRGDGLYGTESGGSSWVAMNQGLHDLDVRDIAVSVAMPHMMYLATSGGVYMSRDAGTTWEELDGPASDWCANTVVAHPMDENVVFVGLRHRSVYYSLDAGVHWVPLKRGLGELTVWSLAVDSRDSAVLWAGTADGVYRYIFELPVWPTAAGVVATERATLEPTATPTVVPEADDVVSPTRVFTPTEKLVLTPTSSPTPTDTREPTVTQAPGPLPTVMQTLTPTMTAEPRPPTATSPPPTETPIR